MIAISPRGLRLLRETKGEKGLFYLAAEVFEEMANQMERFDNGVWHKSVEISQVATFPKGTEEHSAVEFVYGIISMALRNDIKNRRLTTFDNYSEDRPLEDVGPDEIGMMSEDKTHLHFSPERIHKVKNEILNLREKILFGIVRSSKKDGCVKTIAPINDSAEGKIAMLALLLQAYNIPFENLKNKSIRIEQEGIVTVRQGEGHEKSTKGIDF